MTNLHGRSDYLRLTDEELRLGEVSSCVHRVLLVSSRAGCQAWVPSTSEALLSTPEDCCLGDHVRKTARFANTEGARR